MILPDVNVLVYAHREDAADHLRFKRWLQATVDGPEAFAVSEIVLSGFVRVVTHPRVFHPPTPIAAALDFCSYLREQPNVVMITPGPRHWQIFSDLCARVRAAGNMVPDAYLAAIAIEAGCEWITTDRDYARFPALRWRHPF